MEMACYVPFNNMNLDVSIFAFRPTVMFVDDIIHALKQFSAYSQTHLACLHSSILTSIHGSMIVWYGAWIKRTEDKKQLLISTLLSVLTNVESMAILSDHTFFDAYSGESRDGGSAAKFTVGDIITLTSLFFSGDEKSVSYTWLAIFKDQFMKVDGAKAGVCLKSQSMQRIVSLVVWKSLHLCYTYILSDYRNKIFPYLDDFEVDMKYDVFRVVYVSGLNLELYSHHNHLC